MKPTVKLSDNFSIKDRLKARRIFRRRVYEQQGEQIRRRAKAGAITGLLAAVAWGGAIGLSLLIVFRWVVGDPFRSIFGADFFGLVGILLILVMALGTLFGWRAATGAAKDAALHGEGRWFQIVIHERILLFLLTVFFGWLCWLLFADFSYDYWKYWQSTSKQLEILISDRLGMSYVGSILSLLIEIIAFALLGFVVALSWILINAGLVRANRGCVWPRTTELSTWLWSLAPSLSWPLLLATLIFSGLYLWTWDGSDTHRRSQVLEVTALFATLGVALMSLLVSVMTISVARTSSANEIKSLRTIKIKPSLFFRGLALMSFIPSLLWFHYFYGLDTVPFWAYSHKNFPSCEQGAATEIEAKLGPGFPDKSLFRIHFPDSPDNVFQMIGALNSSGQSDNVAVKVQGRLRGEELIPNEKVLVFPASYLEIGVTNLEFGRQYYRLLLVSKCIRDFSTHTKLTDEEMSFFRVKLYRSKDKTNILEGSLENRADSGPKSLAYNALLVSIPKNQLDNEKHPEGFWTLDVSTDETLRDPTWNRILGNVRRHHGLVFLRHGSVKVEDSFTILPIGQNNWSLNLAMRFFKRNPEEASLSRDPVPQGKITIADPGTYETIRATEVYEKPSGASRIVSNISRGTRVKVVGSDGDWFEVHAMRGNPLGFIRRDDVLFVDLPNEKSIIVGLKPENIIWKEGGLEPSQATRLDHNFNTIWASNHAGDGAWWAWEAPNSEQVAFDVEFFESIADNAFERVRGLIEISTKSDGKTYVASSHSSRRGDDFKPLVEFKPLKGTNYYFHIRSYSSDPYY